MIIIMKSTDCSKQPKPQIFSFKYFTSLLKIFPHLYFSIFRPHCNGPGHELTEKQVLRAVMVFWFPSPTRSCKRVGYTYHVTSDTCWVNTSYFMIPPQISAIKRV